MLGGCETKLQWFQRFDGTSSKFGGLYGPHIKDIVGFVQSILKPLKVHSGKMEHYYTAMVKLHTAVEDDCKTCQYVY